jgi:hypothetical protein
LVEVLEQSDYKTVIERYREHNPSNKNPYSMHTVRNVVRRERVVKHDMADYIHIAVRVAVEKCDHNIGRYMRLKRELKQGKQAILQTKK